MHFGCRGHFLEVRQRAERSRFRFTGAAARNGDQGEGGKADGGNDAEHGGSQKGFYGFREKNDCRSKIAGRTGGRSTLR